MELLYGVVNARGELVSVTSTQREAVAEARYDSRGPVVVLTGGPDAGARRNAPFGDRAFDLTALPVVDFDDVMRLSVSDAYWGEVDGRSIQSFMPSATARSNKYPNKPARSASFFAGDLMTSNAKLDKDANKKIKEAYGLDIGREIETWGLNLSPSRRAWEYVDPPRRLRRAQVPTVCAGASKECIAGCLISTGSAREGGKDWEGRRASDLSVDELLQFGLKVKYTQALYHNPEGFIRLLVDSIERKVRWRRKQGIEVFIRLNVFSDIPWEVFCPGLFRHFAGVPFYDYTKVAGRRPPPNYHLTFSYSGFNKSLCREELARGTNVAVVFLNPEGIRQQPVPIDDFWGRPAISGDLYDARPLDEKVLRFVAPRARTAVITLYYKLPKSLAGPSIRASRLGKFVIGVHRDAETGEYLTAETANQTLIKIDE